MTPSFLTVARLINTQCEYIKQVKNPPSDHFRPAMLNEGALLACQVD